MIEAIVTILVVLVVLGLTVTARSLKVVQQFKRGIVFRFGKIQSPPRRRGTDSYQAVGDRCKRST